ncbi:MAG: Mur ligase family protein, partial [Candidatus Cryptobacteroides sp.]
MIISKIIEGCRIVSLEGRTDVEVLSVCSDSRKVGAGSMFVAVRGFAVNGHDFIEGAISKGACAIVYDDPSAIGSMADGVTYIRVESSRGALGIIASNFYDRPSEKLTLVGITGTNGKTTTVTLLYRLFTRLGYNCGLLSTIANYVGSKGTEAVNTTSDPLTINSLMSQMVEEGCQWCFMEVSSIGVEQERIAGLKFKAGIFSNLTHDHLDYHKTFAEYLRCKKLFFDNLPSDAFAIVNI